VRDCDSTGSDRDDEFPVGSGIGGPRVLDAEVTRESMKTKMDTAKAMFLC
jgi:hypothetical protein